jgi:hypothetical protein
MLKGELKECKDSGMSGKLFTCVLMDISGSEVYAVFVNELAVRHHALLKTGAVYLFSRGKARVSRPNHDPTGNPYTLYFDACSTIEPTADDIRPWGFKGHITPLRGLRSLEVGSLVTVCAGVVEAGPLRQIISQAGEKTVLRQIKITDDSDSAELVLLGQASIDPAYAKESGPTPVLLARDLSITSDPLLILASTSTSRLYYNEFSLAPCIRLQAANAPSPTSAVPYDTNYDNFATLREIKAAGLHTRETYTVIGCLGEFYIKNSVYLSCISERCRKSLSRIGDNRCRRCGTVNTKGVLRYKLSLKIHDSTGFIQAKAFDDAGKAIFGVSAEAFSNLVEFASEALQLQHYCKQLCFRVQVSYSKLYNSNYNVVDACPVNYQKVSEVYLQEIAEALEQGTP